VFEVLGTFRPTLFAATPSLYGQLAHDHRHLGDAVLPGFASVRLAVSGAEALPPPLARRVRAVLGIDLLDGFGLTEAMHFVLSNLPGAAREGSVGRPLRGIEARVVDESGRPLAAQEIGFLEVRGRSMARGYVSAEGWVRPGDRFLVDEDGYYYHCGRGDDLFKVGGRWVDPQEVERTMLVHPAVWECAVVEGHDEDGLARPVAFVVPNVGHEPTPELAAELTELVKREISPHKYPREVVFQAELPRDARGRVQRFRLKRDLGAR
jgi:benzoate-CoA ligase